MKKLLVLLTACLLSAPAFAQSPAAPPVINASSAVLIETETNTILFEKNADAVIPPASMTKLMTIHIALNFIEENEISADTLVPVSTSADFRNSPPRSSLMFIEEGQKVSIMELLTGLALPSGNDAGIAVAEFVAGSVPDFVEMMNSEAERLGLEHTHFDDSSGYSEYNKTTASEYASFCSYYLNDHPDAARELHSLMSFTYPKDQNLPQNGSSVHGPITQRNHNLLIGRMDGVDGLKTGYIDESGYNLAASAEFNGRRFILVTMGGPGEDSRDGALRRVIDGAALFTYGVYGWTTLTPEVPENRTLRIWGGEKDELKLSFSPADKLTVPSTAAAGLSFCAEYSELVYPIKTGSKAGIWKLTGTDGTVLQTGTITAAETVEKGNIVKRVLDRFKRPE